MLELIFISIHFSSDNSAMEQSNISNLHQLNSQELRIIIVRIMIVHNISVLPVGAGLLPRSFVFSQQVLKWNFT